MSKILVQPRFEQSLTLLGRAANTISIHVKNLVTSLP